MHILTLLALLTLLSLGVQLLVSDKVDAVHYGLVLLAGVLILGGQIHENKLNQTLTANKYRTTVTYRPPNVGYQRNEKENYEP